MSLPIDVALHRLLGTVAFGVLMLLVYRGATPNGEPLEFGIMVLLMLFILALLGLADIAVAFLDRYTRGGTIKLEIDNDSGSSDSVEAEIEHDDSDEE